MKFDIDEYINERKDFVNKRLEKYLLNPKNNHSRLYDSIRYSLLSDGKRLRPLLCIATYESLTGDYSQVVPLACALEMIHTYSIVHDDLPSMDDDDLRRGKPTNHSVYGEAIAILAGDALLTDAFNLIVSEGIANNFDSNMILKVIDEISSAAGSEGMVLGQSIDLTLEGRGNIGLDSLKNMHSLKTGAMIKASVLMGAYLAGVSSEKLVALESFSEKIGLAYQIIDDLLDLQDSEVTGKNSGSDKKKSKITFTSVLGITESRNRASKLTTEAIDELKKFNDTFIPLIELAEYIGKRDH